MAQEGKLNNSSEYFFVQKYNIKHSVFFMMSQQVEV